VLIVLVRRTFAPFVRRDPQEQAPSFTHRLVVAFWSTLIPSLAAAFFVLASLALLYGFKVLREDIGQILRSYLWVAVGIYFIWKLSRGIAAPGKPQWRLIRISEDGARRLVAYSVLLALVNGVSYIVDQTNFALGAPVVITVAQGFISSVIIGLILIRIAFVRPMAAAEQHNGAWPRTIRLIFLATGIGLILTAFFGYIGLAQFAATQLVVTGALLVSMYIGWLSGHAISQTDAFGKTMTGQYLQRRYRLSAIRLDQVGLVAGLAVYFLVCAIGIPLIMLKWGFRAADIWGIFVHFFTEIRIGNITISMLGIFAGLLVFAGGFLATRWFQGWLDGNVMARSQVDIGVRNSVNTVLGYAGIFIAGLIGISAAGINLSSLALVAGALSLGIGFGLQTIVQNFVSGLILLIERPFKVGDWIVNGPVEGFVRRISVRATEIETFQNQSIIVPNSQLINAAVGNWTLHNTVARSEVQVSVSYDSDPRQVMDLLLEIATSHPLVLTMPEPNVGFQAFGQFSMDFELRFYLADLFQGGPVKNEIRATIIERFRKEGIVIPIPQSNIVVHSADDNRTIEEALTEEGLSPEAARRVLLRAERRQKVSRSLAREMDLVDDERGPHDGLHHATDADGDGEPDDTR
jgi:potassium-dependent mechanosensitive channel